jgi:RND family efflux transporter MFP subunit
MSRSGNLSRILAVAILVEGCGRDVARDAQPGASEAPSVPVARVERTDLAEVVTIPAEFRAYVETELRAKEGGYIGKMNVDFGDRVKAGDLLATIEVPELADELNSARAAAERAEADYTNAHLIYSRILSVNHDHPNLVAQQDVDTAAAKDLTAQAAIASAQADVTRYQTLAGYTNITAPFDGVVTHRYLDPGALVEERSDVLRVSDNYRLRLDFPVSVKYVKDIKIGDEVEVVVESLNGRKFNGKITRATGRVNDDTRTMTTEIEVANSNLEVAPGMYASVAMNVDNRPHALAIPLEAIPVGQAASVYVVNSQNEVEERPVTLGLVTPTKYEVVSGLSEGEMVVLGSRSRIRVGEKVQSKVLEPLAER